MMFGTVMISNSTSNHHIDETSNPRYASDFKMNNNNQMTNNSTNNSNLLLLTTAPSSQTNSTNQQINTISQLISSNNKYQLSEMSDTEKNERTNSVYRNTSKNRSMNHQLKSNWQTSNTTNQSFDQVSISSQANKILANNHSNKLISGSVYSTSSNSQSKSYRNNMEPPLPSLPPPQNPQLSRSVNHDHADLNNQSVYDKIKDSQFDHQQKRDNDNEKIQVQILPMDDNWGESNTTAHTADFSDFNDDMTEDGRSSHFNFNPKSIDLVDESNLGVIGSIFQVFKKNFGLICAFSMSFCSFLTPILFILLPRININQWQINECGLECEGLLIGIAFKLFILLIGNWAIFLRKPKSSLPRIYELRALLVFFLCIMTFSYWLFYAVRIIEMQTQDYFKILQFTVSYVDVLLFIFIISVFVLELRHLQPQYVVKIVRSPDGQEEEYTIGNMSIQRAAVWILEQYYKDFKAYNPWLENAHRKRAAQLLQLEQLNNRKGKSRAASSNNLNQDDNLDNPGENDDAESTKGFYKKGSKSSKSKYNNGSMVAINLNANDRLYEEYEYERRLKKRKARLLITTEEAFNHIRRIQDENGSQNDLNEAQKSMDPFEAAQAVFTSIARDLRRYLRITRQQPFFTRDSIIAHLANCISYDMTPKSFLKRYLDGESLVFNDRAMSINQQRSRLNPNTLESRGMNYNINLKTMDQTWILISDSALYQSVEDNLMIVLKQNEVTLMCTFKRLPRFNLIEDILDPKRNKFILKINSETTV